MGGGLESHHLLFLIFILILFLIREAPSPTRARALARGRPPSSPRTMAKSIFRISNLQGDFAYRRVAITRYIVYFQGIHIHKFPRGYTFTNPLEIAIFDLKKNKPEDLAKYG